MNKQNSVSLCLGSFFSYFKQSTLLTNKNKYIFFSNHIIRSGEEYKLIDIWLAHRHDEYAETFSKLQFNQALTNEIFRRRSVNYPIVFFQRDEIQQVGIDNVPGHALGCISFGKYDLIRANRSKNCRVVFVGCFRPDVFDSNLMKMQRTQNARFHLTRAYDCVIDFRAYNGTQTRKISGVQTKRTIDLFSHIINAILPAIDNENLAMAG